MNERITMLREHFSYNPETGEVARLKGTKARRISLSKSSNYTGATILGQHYQLHRLAWELHYGEDAPEMVDHINGDRRDNRIENLRAANASGNAHNRRTTTGRTGPKGVRSGHVGRFRAEIHLNNVCHHLGVFDTRDEAAHAYNKAAVRLHGEFACLNPVGMDEEDSAPAKPRDLFAMNDYSDTQRTVMRFVCRYASNKGGEVQIAGDRRAPWLAACRALVRKGLMRSWHSGKYALTDEGQQVAEQMLAEWRETRAAAQSELSAKDGGVAK